MITRTLSFSPLAAWTLPFNYCSSSNRLSRVSTWKSFSRFLGWWSANTAISNSNNNFSYQLFSIINKLAFKRKTGWCLNKAAHHQSTQHRRFPAVNDLLSCNAELITILSSRLWNKQETRNQTNYCEKLLKFKSDSVFSRDFVKCWESVGVDASFFTLMPSLLLE
jgi:hypothetical protein